jgi:hypothetical protein
MLKLNSCSAFLSAGLLIAMAAPVGAIGNDWTAVTVARNGMWGSATGKFLSQTILGAIGACKVRSDRALDCGALVKVSRGGWIVADRCGSHNVVAAGRPSNRPSKRRSTGRLI